MGREIFLIVSVVAAFLIFLSVSADLRRDVDCNASLIDRLSAELLDQSKLTASALDCVMSIIEGLGLDCSGKDRRETSVRIKKMRDNAVIPTRGSNSAAGYDLYSTEDVTLWPHSMALVPSGIAMEIPEGYFGGLYPRSGLSTRNGVRLANCVAVIDSDYRGEIGLPLYNDSDVKQFITAGTRVAQIVIQPYSAVQFTEADTLGETARGEGGFGSTGK